MDSNKGSVKTQSEDHQYDSEQDSLNGASTEIVLKKHSSKVDPLDLLHSQELQELSASSPGLEKPLKAYQDTTFNKQPIVNLEEISPISRKIVACLPTSVAVCTNFIAVGNTKSQVFLFSSLGAFLKVLEIKRKDFGEVMAMAFDPEETALLAGFERGQLALWELKTGNCIRASNSVHKAPVSALAFCKKSRQFVVSSDLAGNLMESKISKSKFSSSIKAKLLGQFGICVEIQPLIEYRFPTEVCDLLAISTLESVIVLRDGREIFSISRPELLEFGSTASISWSVKQGRSPILGMAWNTKIILYEFKKPTAEFISVLGFYEMDIEIKKINWLDADIMTTISRTRELKVIKIDEFTKDEQEHYAQEDSKPVDIAPQSFVKYRSGKENMTIHNSVKAANKNLYVLGKRDFTICSILDWTESLQSLINQEEWLQVLSFGLDIYQGKLKIESTQVDVKLFLERIAKEFVRSVVMDRKLEITLEFCLGIDADDLFFNDLFEFFLDDVGKLAIALEYYFLAGEIHVIPNSCLEKLAEYYVSEDRVDMLEKIALHLEPTSIDPSLLIPPFKEKNRTTGLFYLFTQRTQQFVSPLMAIYNLVLTEQEPRQRKHYTYKLLWFIRLCLRGETFPFGQISPEQYKDCTSKVLDYILETHDHMGHHDNRLKILLEIDAQVTLDVFWEVFTGKAKNILVDQQHKVLSRLKEEIQGSFAYQLSVFIAKVASVNQSIILKPVRLAAIKEMMRPHRRQFNRTFSQATNIQKFIDITVELDTYTHEPELSAEEKGEIMLKMLKNCKLENPEVEELLRLVMNTPYTEVMIYLQELMGRFRECIRNFIRSDRLSIRFKIFDWISHMQEELGQNRFRHMVQDEIMDCLDVLVQIDTDKTAKIVKEWFQDDHARVISKLNLAPELQLKYLLEIMKTSEESVLQEDVIMKYIELTAQYNPSEVLNFLKKSSRFNFEDALAICKKFKVHDATSYLHEALGDPKNALRIYLDLIGDRRDIMTKGGRVSDQDIHSLVKEFRKGIEICQRNAKGLDEHDNMDIWFPLLSNILRLYKDFGKSYFFDKLENIILESVRTVLESMADYIPFDRVMELIDRNYGDVPFKFFKDSLISLLSKYSNQTNILRTANGLFSKNINVQNDELLKLRKQGISSGDFVCAACQQLINHKKMISAHHKKFSLYICGHVFHERCNLKNQCILCSEE